MRRFCLTLAFALACLVIPSRLTGAEPLKNCALEPGNTPIAYGDILGGSNCEINPPTDVDLFNFTGSNGEKVRIVGLRFSGGNALCAELRDPDGIGVPGGFCTSGTFQADFTLVKTGQYTLIIQESGNDQTTTYGLTLIRLFPSTGSPVIDYSQVLMNDLDPVPDQDLYRISGTAGDTIRLIALRSGGNAICLGLQDPDGMDVPGGFCTSGTFQADFPLTKTGVHTAIIAESGSDQTASYTLSLHCIFGTCSPKLPVCDVSATYAAGTLNLNFTLRTIENVSWGVWATVFGSTIPLWSVPVPPVDPAATFPLSIPGLPSLGAIGFLTTFAHSTKGITCWDFATVDTGPPGPAASAITPDELRRLIQPRR